MLATRPSPVPTASVACLAVARTVRPAAPKKPTAVRSTIICLPGLCSWARSALSSRGLVSRSTSPRTVIRTALGEFGWVVTVRNSVPGLGLVRAWALVGRVEWAEVEGGGHGLLLNRSKGVPATVRSGR